jgi:triphosphoribosyl-dephospho-CoA synthase
VRSPVENAELALLLEVAGTPKPGNVDRERDHPDLRFEHFLAGAVGARAGFAMAAAGDPLGESFERAIAGMAAQRGGNTQFGAVLLCLPLVAAAGAEGPAEQTLPERASEIAKDTTVDDAAGFYRAFEHVDVAVDDPPAALEPLDVRRGSAAIPALRERGLTLWGVMEASADRDGVAEEWVEGFPRSAESAAGLLSATGPVGERVASVYLDRLTERPDTFVATTHGEAVAERVLERARAVRDGNETAEALADDLVSRGINPGTTADVVAGGLFLALQRGLEV